MIFYLGAHMPSWFGRVDIPLFVSHRRLNRQRRLPRARAPWALDSGAFSEIAQNGSFSTTPWVYARAIARYQREIGLLDWVAPQDHMTEPWVLARSEIASTVGEAQRWTVDNYLELKGIDDTLPIIPVLQGQTLGDYTDHIAMYNTVGIDLTAEPLVGLGSVCRRQATTEIAELIAVLSQELRLHGFGVKTDGLDRYGWMLATADSMAWSYSGRRIKPCPLKGLTSCANCLHYAIDWRLNVLTGLERHDPVQMAMW